MTQPHVPEERYHQIHRFEKPITVNLEIYCHGKFEDSVPVLAWRDRIKLEIP